MINRYSGYLFFSVLFSLMAESSYAQSLKIVYPPQNHQTIAESIFIIGSTPSDKKVTINAQPIVRSQQGFFAPSIPLKMGENELIIRYGEEVIKRTIIRQDNQPSLTDIQNLSPSILTPSVDKSILPQERVCFSALTPQNAETKVMIGGKTINLTPSLSNISLPPNSAVLTGDNQPSSLIAMSWHRVTGCTSFNQTKSLLTPQFVMNYQGKNLTSQSKGNISILDPENLIVVEIIAEQGVARTGAGTNFSRLTPLPKGTRALVTATEGEWLRLDYGGWILASETKVLPTNTPPSSFIRSVTSRQQGNQTQVIFPLETPIPITIRQSDNTLTLILHNAIAQTDTIFFPDNPVIKRLDWYQNTPTTIEYIFTFKSSQQWGYDVRYEGSTLILSFNNPPISQGNNLKGKVILLDPGHGGEESGAVGPNGYTEKEINLVISQLLAEKLRAKGATVYLTRNDDTFVSLFDRQKKIEQLKPTIALSIHYNALPDGGNAETTKGIGVFWYHPQAHNLSVFLHDYLVENLQRPSYGIFWNNLALTRPHTSPTVLLELGFMINPYEFEWIINTSAQRQLATTLAEGVEKWLIKHHD